MNVTPDPAWFIRPNGFSAADTIHGLGHTRRVLIHALEIADALGIDGWEREAIICAALWHDIGRTDDGVDYYHGAKSAGKVVALGLHRFVEQRVYETALFAVTHHSGDENHGERAANDLRYQELQPDGTYAWREIDPVAALRVFRVLKDADALDRVRLGDLDPSYLRFDVSRTRVDRAWALLREIGQGHLFARHRTRTCTQERVRGIPSSVLRPSGRSATTRI